MHAIGDFVSSVVGLIPETLGPSRCRLDLSVALGDTVVSL